MRVEIKQDSWNLNSLDEIVEKMMNAKAKIALMSCFYTCETDQYGAQGNYLLATKSYAQNSSLRDPRAEESKT